MWYSNNQNDIWFFVVDTVTGVVVVVDPPPVTVVVEVTVTAVHILPNTSSVKLTKTINLDFVDSENFIEFESLTKENVLSFIDKTVIENELQEKINQYGKVYKMPANW